MKKKKLIIILSSIAVVIFLTSLTYRCVKNYCSFRDETLLYEKALIPIEDKDNPFYPKESLKFYDSMLNLPSNTPKQTMVAQFFKAATLLKLGKEKEAVEIMQTLSEKLGSEDDKFTRDVRAYLALAYLRLGERNNCISSHSMESCIFPIMGKGIYMDPDASRKSISIFQQILQRDSNDLASRWLLNLAYMTIGEYPGKVPALWLIPGLDKDTSTYKIKPFEDMAGSLKLISSIGNQAGGAIIDDFDNDGYLDIITSNWSLNEAMHYFKNNGDGTFTDVSEKSGLSKIKGGLNIIQADYNNDGYTDILVIRGAWLGEYGNQPKTLLRNNGDGTFTDVTVESGILSFSPTQAAVWADFNNDGWLDLFIANESRDWDNVHPSELYINNHDGTFTNVADKAGCETTAFMKGVTVGDYNNDGWPDIFISDLNGHKILFKNKGIKGDIPQFENATHEAGLDKDVTYTFPTWFFDYDNDGWPDIFVCGYQFQGTLASVAAAEALGRSQGLVSKMYLYRNNHDGTFTNVSKKVGLDRSVFGMGANFGDIDNDGWPDMYIGTGNPDFRSLVPNRMFKNINGEKFADVTSSARVGNLQKGHAVAFADVDNDGDQDIFIEVGGAYPGDAYYNSFYINPGQNNNNWISVLLEGKKSNRSAIGAHIAVSFTEDGVKRTVYTDVNSGGSFGSNPLRKEIGIGKAKLIDELIIKWPTTGIVQVFKNIQPRQFLKITEGDGQIQKMNLKQITFKNEPGHMNMQ